MQHSLLMNYSLVVPVLLDVCKALKSNDNVEKQCTMDDFCCPDSTVNWLENKTNRQRKDNLASIFLCSLI